MLITSAMLSFDSAAFPVADGEDAETNPGIFGKSLAEWLGLRLAERGVKAKPPFAEDWGWCIELVDQPYRMGLSCASEDHEKAAWRVYAFADVGLLGRFRQKDAATSAVGELLQQVREILAGEPSVTRLRSDDE